MMWRVQGADKLKMSIYMNNKKVFNYNVTGTRLLVGTISEVMPNHVLKKGAGRPNTILFIKESGSGHIVFSDVVIWFRAVV